MEQGLEAYRFWHTDEDASPPDELRNVEDRKEFMKGYWKGKVIFHQAMDDFKAHKHPPSAAFTDLSFMRQYIHGYVLAIKIHFLLEIQKGRDPLESSFKNRKFYKSTYFQHIREKAEQDFFECQYENCWPGSGAEVYFDTYKDLVWERGKLDAMLGLKCNKPIWTSSWLADGYFYAYCAGMFNKGILDVVTTKLPADCPRPAVEAYLQGRLQRISVMKKAATSV